MQPQLDGAYPDGGEQELSPEEEDAMNAHCRKLFQRQQQLLAQRRKERMEMRQAPQLLRARCRYWSTADFQPLRVLGKGAFGVVYLVEQRSTSKLYALKRMSKRHYEKKNSFGRAAAFAERDVMIESRCEWCINILCSFQDSANIYLVMDFVQGGDFKCFIARKVIFTVEETAFYIAELLAALNEVHIRGIVHRDVKPDNVLVTASGHLKLMDFGLCTLAEDIDEDQMTAQYRLPSRLKAAPNQWQMQTICSPSPQGQPTSRALPRMRIVSGTPQYMAPEMFHGICSPESDIWALGIIAYRMLSTTFPFYWVSRDTESCYMVFQHIVINHEKYLPERLDTLRDRQLSVNGTEQEILGAVHFISKVLCHRKHRLCFKDCCGEEFFRFVDFDQLLHMTPPIQIPLANAQDTSMFDDFSDEPLELSPREALDKQDPTLEWLTYAVDGEYAAAAHSWDKSRPTVSRAAAAAAATS
eukprot:TRINITY_DN67941_c0_g1_i1.p1 TRINITY_DN67941_c0_g1~~TRINITY_DN67941_c0_g1_i1.p1  ORF type:complete len:498 (-),score=82.03 TRINITY_DN67941_c0_g1_i1:101-1513(-)